MPLIQGPEFLAVGSGEEQLILITYGSYNDPRLIIEKFPIQITGYCIQRINMGIPAPKKYRTV